jgi:hypothetical protein
VNNCLTILTLRVQTSWLVFVCKSYLVNVRQMTLQGACQMSGVGDCVDSVHGRPLEGSTGLNNM